MTNKLVSIAMCTFNGEKFLREQLDSILSQTHSFLEIIICDDVSTDATASILQEYVSKDSRIKVFINNQNIGLVKNFEKALSLCSGEYIALSDQDDIWEQNKIATLLRHIGDSQLIHSDAKLINEKGIVFAESYAFYSKKNMCTDCRFYISGNNNVTGCTILFKNELLPHILPIPDGITAHDWWIALIASNYGKIDYFSHPLIHYRQHASNLVGATSSEKMVSINPLELRTFSYKRTLIALISIQKNIKLKSKNQLFLDSLIYYYNDYFTKSFRIHSFLFHIKNFSLFQQNKPLYVKVLALLSSLIGKNQQQKISRLFK
jgi:glycosyltransferase involved in cell wall biosynthesis